MKFKPANFTFSSMRALFRLDGNIRLSGLGKSGRFRAVHVPKGGPLINNALATSPGAAMNTDWDEYYVVVGFGFVGAALAPIEVTFLADAEIAADIIDDDAEELAAVCLYRLTPGRDQSGNLRPVLLEARGDVPERWRQPSVDDIFNTRRD